MIISILMYYNKFHGFFAICLIIMLTTIIVIIKIEFDQQINHVINVLSRQLKATQIIRKDDYIVINKQIQQNVLSPAEFVITLLQIYNTNDNKSITKIKSIPINLITYFELNIGDHIAEKEIKYLA